MASMVRKDVLKFIDDADELCLLLSGKGLSSALWLLVGVHRWAS